MGFEVFDDVAAFWFTTTLLFFLVVPRGVWLLWSLRRELRRRKEEQLAADSWDDDEGFTTHNAASGSSSSSSSSAKSKKAKVLSGLRRRKGAAVRVAPAKVVPVSSGGGSSSSNGVKKKRGENVDGNQDEPIDEQKKLELIAKATNELVAKATSSTSSSSSQQQQRNDKSSGSKPAHALDGTLCECKQCVVKRAKLQREERSRRWRKHFTLFNVVYAVLVVVFVYMLVQVPTMHTKKMYEFNPYEILDIEIGASVPQIKRAYRKKSLVYHPDKNPGDKDAERRFIEVSKAYQTLTDDAARENFEKYGNPDGPTAVSVTIGLPSFLTSSENEVTVLLAYVVALIMLPVIVGLWWKKASQYHESGVLYETFARFSYLIQENQSARALIEVLATSAEYMSLAPKIDRITPAEQSLHNKVKLMLPEKLIAERKAPKEVRKRIVFPALDLLYAYMLREEVPKELQNELMMVLKQAPLLVDGMVQVALEKGALVPARMCVEMQQLITQQLFIDDKSSALLQLPHVTGTVLRKCKKYHVSTVADLRRLKPKHLVSVLEELNARQLRELVTVVNLIPEMQIKHKVEIEGVEDDDVCAGDIVTIKLKLKRAIPHFNVSAVVADQAKRQAKADAKRQQQQQQQKDQQGEEQQQQTTGKNDSVSERKRNIEAYDSDDDKGGDGEEEEEDDPLKLQWKGWDPQRLRNNDVPDEVYAHAPRFPFPRQEHWYVLFIDKQTKRCMDVKRIHSLGMRREIVFKFRIPTDAPLGTRMYEVMVLCDSYVGCDVTVPIRFDVTKPKPEIEPVKIREGDDEEEEEEIEAYWYYLGGSSFVEFLLILFILVIIFNVLYAKGYIHLFYSWYERYLEWLLSPVLSPIFGFINKYVYDLSSAVPVDVDSSSYYEE